MILIVEWNWIYQCDYDIYLYGLKYLFRFHMIDFNIIPCLRKNGPLPFLFCHYFEDILSSGLFGTAGLWRSILYFNKVWKVNPLTPHMYCTTYNNSNNEILFFLWYSYSYDEYGCSV